MSEPFGVPEADRTSPPSFTSTASSLPHLHFFMGSAKHRQQPSRHLPGRGPTPASINEQDRETLQFNVRLAKARQAQADINRIERKAFREHARIENAVAAYTRELCARLDEQQFTKGLQLTPIPEGGDSVLVVQLSDLHFNEQVNLPSNQYNFTIAAQRLRKLAQRVKQLGASYGARKVVVACLGDFLNSDRRLDELQSNATNRSCAAMLAVEILKTFLLDLRDQFQIEVYGITGNESRVTKELGWSDSLATDNYDMSIYATLKLGFGDTDGIRFCGFQANELLFKVMGRTFLCLHGHQIGANVQKSVQEIMGKYAAQGITVDYTLFGHLHASAIGDYHARNASLVGSNAYSEAGLNFCSKAAQNVHIVTAAPAPKGKGKKAKPAAATIDGMKVDLQDVTGIEPYAFNREWEAYSSKSERKLHSPSVVYQVVV